MFSINRITLLSLLLVSSSSFALSVKQSPSLSRLIVAMGQAAYNTGENILHFEVKEKFWVNKDLKTCKVTTGKRIVRDFVQYYKMLDNPAPQYYKQGLRDLYRIVGQGRYYVCKQIGYGHYSYTQTDSFIGIDKKYRIQIITGWED